MLSQMTNTFFPICSFFVSTLIIIVFNSKKSVKNKETNLYSKLITIGFLESLVMLFICLIVHPIFSDKTYSFFT